MEMPKALETVLSALLNNHTVTSWKVAAEPGNNPAVVIRLRPRDSQDGEINTHFYRRKPASQVRRDRARQADFKRRLEVRYENKESHLSHVKADENPVISVDTCFSKEVTHKVCSVPALNTETESGAGESENCVTECKQKRPYTPSPPNTLPDPSRPTEQHEDNARPPPPLSPTHSARDARTFSSDQMDTADGAEGGWGSEGGVDTETEWEDEVREIIADKVKHSDCSKLTRDLIQNKARNKSFQRVVIDRRGQSVPTLVCFSSDVILTVNTGTGDKDIFILERRSTGTGEGDKLHRACLLWPNVDRGGVYKDSIDDFENDLPWIMDIVRGSLSRKS